MLKRVNSKAVFIKLQLVKLCDAKLCDAKLCDAKPKQSVEIEYYSEVKFLLFYHNGEFLELL
jgi:hypothetical protein